MELSVYRSTRRIMSYLVPVLFVLATLTGVAMAQTETGQIIGRVTDPSGALVPGANITVRSEGTGATRTATSKEDGNYIVSNLPPGIYEVTVQAAGFANSVTRVNITVGSQTPVESALSVAGVTGETVNVIAGGGVEVNTVNQELSTVVSATQIRELPTLTRNPYSLIALSGNVSPGDPSGRGAGFAINGQRASSTNILLDGADNNDTFRASVGQSVPLDSVQEFRVITSNFSAEYGRAAGGVVNVATRAGTNDFHGTLYEFNRVSRLASNGFDRNARGLQRGVFTRNQFGYSVGGPVVLPNFGEGGPSTRSFRDKLFFFSSTEWTRVRSSGSRTEFVPAPQLIAASSAATRAFFAPYPTRAPITGRIRTAGQIKSEFNITSGAFFALPNDLPAFGEVTYSIPQDLGAGTPQNTYQTVNRIDWNISPKATFYARYALEDSASLFGTVSPSPYEGFSSSTASFNQNMLASLTYTFTPNFVSQTKIVYNRLNDLTPLGDQPPGPTLYLRSSTSRIAGNLLAFPGYLPFNPGSAIPFGGPQNLGQVYQDFNYQTGKHQFRFGGQYVYIQDNRTFGAFLNSVQTLGSSFAAGFNNLVSGNLISFQGAIDPRGSFPGDPITLPAVPPLFSRSNRYNEYALYFNDNWRVRPNLTLNLGVRYEFYGVQQNKDPNLDANFYYGQGSNIFEQIRNGRVFRAPESPVGALWETDPNNFAPRVGFAWDIFGNGSTSLRGGYGISYERNFGNVTFNVIQNPPNYAVVSLVAGSDVPTLTITPNNAGPLAGTGRVTLPRTSLRHVNQNIVNAYAHFWSAALERKVSEGTVASVEYSGSAGRNLYSLEDPNRVGGGRVYLGDASATSRLNSQYSNLNTRSNSGYSNYNALILGLESSNLRNLGLQFTARYTYSVAKDNLSSTFSESANNFNLGLLDPFNPELDYGNADFDIRHRFTGSFNWAVGGNRIRRDGFLGAVAGGWTLTGIVTARTGTPFTVFDCTRAQFAVCPRLVPTGPINFRGTESRGTSTSQNQFLLVDLSNQTPGNFVNPLTGNSEFGPFPSNMTERNAFRGPGFWNIDTGLYKNFGITEGTSLQFRAEVYNLFNHANLFTRGSTAEVNFNIPGIGRGVSGFRDGRRNVQLAVKFIF